MQVPQETRHVPTRTYVLVFVALAVLTALEIGVTYLPIPRAPVLVPMALAKAALVVLFYMHLKYDRKVLAVLFIFGVLLATSLIISLLLLFGPPLLDMR